MDVEILVGVLKKTIAFEKELAERFGPLIVDDTNVEDDKEPDLKEEQTQEELMNPNSAAAIRARWKRFQQQKQEQVI